MMAAWEWGIEMGILEGKKILVTGVTLNTSIAYSVAQIAQQEGAEIVVSNFGRGMSLTRRVLVILLVVITALVAVVAYRTATYMPLAGDSSSPVELAPAVRIDGAIAAQHLAEGRATPARLGRKVGAAPEGLARRRQEHGQRPAALFAQQVQKLRQGLQSKIMRKIL